MTESFMDKLWLGTRSSISGLVKWLAYIAFHRASRLPASKRKHVHRTRMTMTRGQRLDRARRDSRPGSVEKLGFPRSDLRHPCHPSHFAVYHPHGPCTCVGVGHKREALLLPGAFQ